MTVDLSTTYLGLRLPHPLMPGASPLADDLDTVRRLEDAGAAAIVLRSLFEEQIGAESRAHLRHLESHRESFVEAASFLPGGRAFSLGPEEYLEQIYRIKQTVRVPLIASLNGATPGGWLDFARHIHQAGADALELNVYDLATDPDERGDAVERRCLEMLATVRQAVSIPVAVKLSPYYSGLANFARELCRAGADGLVLFNRFYQPDLDVEALKVVPSLHLSEPVELRLRLRWLAILSGRVDASLAVTGGVHGTLGAIKAVLCGADAVQMVSALLTHGPDHIAAVRREMAEWLEDHAYASLEQARGSMSLLRCPDPRAYGRANYMEILESWSG